MTGDFFSKAMSQVPGLKSSVEAMKASGMQPELAAHLILQCQSLHQCLILRAGSPPVYNQKRGPKSGFNLSKTSTQGLFKGSLALDKAFTRIGDEGIGIGHHEKDTAHLARPIKHKDYQHTVALPIPMLDILRELGPEGDMHVLGYDMGQLRLAYRAGKGDRDFHGQFIIQLLEGHKTPQFFSRPWDQPDHHPHWDSKKQIIAKPYELSEIPDHTYEAVFDHAFTLTYVTHQEDKIDPESIRIAKVFANTPKTVSELLQAIDESHLLDDPTPENSLIRMQIETRRETAKFEEILDLFSEEQLEIIYNQCGLIITGDWDCLALGHPSLSTLSEGYPIEKMRVYNTFAAGSL